MNYNIVLILRENWWCELYSTSERDKDRKKDHKGRHVKGAWLVGLIEDGSEDFRLELCANNEWTANVFHGVIYF